MSQKSRPLLPIGIITLLFSSLWLTLTEFLEVGVQELSSGLDSEVSELDEECVFCDEEDSYEKTIEWFHQR